MFVSLMCMSILPVRMSFVICLQFTL